MGFCVQNKNAFGNKIKDNRYIDKQRNSIMDFGAGFEKRISKHPDGLT